MRRGWTLLYAGLLILSVAVVLLARQPATAEDAWPSVRSPGPDGLEALLRYLEQRGFPARAEDGPLEALGDGLASVVWVAPFARPVSAEELLWAEAFVEGGGTLVLLLPEQLDALPHALREWLALERGATPPVGVLARTADAEVWLPHALLSVTSRLRFTPVDGLRSDGFLAPLAGAGDWTPLLGAVLGTGELYVFAGADVGSNRLLLDADNLRFWEALAARGPLVFWEHHQHGAPAAPLPKALIMAGLQLAALALLAAWALGTRLGPPRPLPFERHRERFEYVEGFARLLARARVEPELAGALHARLRRLLAERGGLSLQADDPEAVATLMRELEEASRMQRLGSRRYAALARSAATLERRLAGNRGAA